MCQNLRVNCTKNLRVNVQRASVLQPSLRPHKALSWDDIVVTDMLADMAADMEVDMVTSFFEPKFLRQNFFELKLTPACVSSKLCEFIHLPKPNQDCVSLALCTFTLRFLVHFPLSWSLSKRRRRERRTRERRRSQRVKGWRRKIIRSMRITSCLFKFQEKCR